MLETVINSRIFTTDEIFEFKRATQLVFLNYGTNPVRVQIKDTVYLVPETPIGDVNPSAFEISNFGHFFDLKVGIIFNEIISISGQKKSIELTNNLVVNYFNIKKQ